MEDDHRLRNQLAADDSIGNRIHEWAVLPSDETIEQQY